MARVEYTNLSDSFHRVLTICTAFCRRNRHSLNDRPLSQEYTIPPNLIVLAIKRPVYYASQTLLFVSSSQFPQGPQSFKAQLRIARGTGNGQETKKGRWDKNVDRFSCLLADQDNEREQTNPG